jgi:hypothetical protein
MHREGAAPAKRVPSLHSGIRNRHGGSGVGAAGVAPLPSRSRPFPSPCLARPLNPASGDRPLKGVPERSNLGSRRNIAPSGI